MDKYGWANVGFSFINISLCDRTRDRISRKTQLRPRVVWLGFYHLFPGNLKDYEADGDIPAGKYYSSDVRADQFQKWLNENTYGEGKRLSCANLLHINRDTTSVQ